MIWEIHLVKDLAKASKHRDQKTKLAISSEIQADMGSRIDIQIKTSADIKLTIRNEIMKLYIYEIYFYIQDLFIFFI